MSNPLDTPNRENPKFDDPNDIAFQLAYLRKVEGLSPAAAYETLLADLSVAEKNSRHLTMLCTIAASKESQLRLLVSGASRDAALDAQRKADTPTKPEATVSLSGARPDPAVELTVLTMPAEGSHTLESVEGLDDSDLGPEALWETMTEDFKGGRNGYNDPRWEVDRDYDGDPLKYD